MHNLILVRHGQSIWNKERRFTGFVDVELTKEGEIEAHHAGRLIRDLNIEFDVYFTSKLKTKSGTPPGAAEVSGSVSNRTFFFKLFLIYVPISQRVLELCLVPPKKL